MISCHSCQQIFAYFCEILSVVINNAKREGR